MISIESRLREACAELDRLVRGGKHAAVEEVLARFPDLAREREHAIELIYTELVAREELGVRPALDELLRRFPEWPDRIARLIEVHDALSRGDEPPAAAATSQSILPLDSAPGARIGGYEILEELGRGGMGVVYKARQPSLNRLVAIKMILVGPHAGSTELGRFRAEAESLALLQHPNIVQIHEVGEQAGHPYFVMEHVDGGNLERTIANKPVAHREAARFVETVAAAIHAAHLKGIIHCDLKPANILLQREGGLTPREQDRLAGGPACTLGDERFIPKLTDFGLARRIEEQPGFTQTGAVLGTPSYMAPEQASGRRHEVSAATDVHALGAVLYSLLTGHPPFLAATTHEILDQVRNREPVSLARSQPNVPRDVEVIVLKCLQKDPRRRYATAEALADDLRRFLDHRPIHARPVGRGERVWRWCRRKPVVAGLTAAIALLAAVILIGGPAAAIMLRFERDRARVAERNALDRLAGAQIAQAATRQMSGQQGQRFESLRLLAEAAEVSPSHSIRDQAIASLALADVETVRTWEGILAPGATIDFDGDLERVAVSQLDGSIRVHRADDDAELLHLPAQSQTRGPVYLEFSPDGQFLAVNYAVAAGENRFVVYSIENGKRLVDVAGAWIAPGGTLFSGDGTLVATSMPNQQVGLFELPSGRQTVTLENVPLVECIAVHPLGRRVAISSARDRVVEIRDAPSGESVLRLEHPSGVRALAWRSDGKVLAAGGDDRQIHVWDVAAGRITSRLKSDDREASFLAFDAGGRFLVVSGLNGHTRIWDPQAARQLVHTDGFALRLNAAGDALAFRREQAAGIWKLEGRPAWRSLYPPGEAATAPGQSVPSIQSLDMQDAFLASAGTDGVKLWDAGLARELSVVSSGNAGAVVFSPDGAGLLTYGKLGVGRFPLAASADPAIAVQVGLEDRLGELANPVDSWGLAFDGVSGRIAATDARRGAILMFDPNGSDKPRPLAGLADPCCVAFSADGQWLAAGSQRRGGFKVFQVESGRVIFEQVARDGVSDVLSIAFSPDGSRLATGSLDEYRLWTTTDWKLDRTFARSGADRRGAALAFSSTGGWLAIVPKPREIQLVRLDHGKVVATLASPEQQVVRGLCFSDDDRQLAAATVGPDIHLWDFSQIRAGLAEIGVACDLP